MLFMLEEKHNDVLINSKKCRIKLCISQDDFDVHDDKYMLAKIISYESKSKNNSMMMDQHQKLYSNKKIL